MTYKTALENIVDAHRAMGEHDDGTKLVDAILAGADALNAGAPDTTLTETQLKALDWVLDAAISQLEGEATSLEPDQALEEVCDLASLVELLPAGDTQARLSLRCDEIRREVTPKPPKVIVTGERNGSSEGHEVANLDAAADWAAAWIRGIDPEDAGVDFRIYVEIQPED